MPKEAIISTSRLNDKGTRILTEGIDYSQYAKNPILLWMHSRPLWGETNEVGVIGRMENLRLDGDRLIGTPVFDMQDEFAAKIARKWENGFLKMLSGGFDIIETSSDPKYLHPGQTGRTLTKTKLIEVSIVDAGSNDDAMTLFYEGKRLNLAAGSADLAFLRLDENENINQNSNNNEQNTKNEMEKIAIQLGLMASASETDILTRIMQIQKENNEAVTLRKEMEQQAATAVEEAVTAAITCSKITADKREHFIKLGNTMGLAALQQTLNVITVPSKPMDNLRQQSATPGGAAVTYKKLSEVPTAELSKMRADDKQEYIRLYKAEYGVTPKI